MNPRRIFVALLLLALSALFTPLAAQPGFKVDIKKERPYEERKLKAEKTGDGKLKTTKRIFQNLSTHYNYYFNANNKLNEVIERARARHRDEFSQLLPFYNYGLDLTAADSIQLDSVIYKCRSGIVSHDLRSEWADELYLLWAKAWHFRQKLDSASLMLQFINYAFAPQEDYGFYSYVGTRKDGVPEVSIATKEEKKFLHSNNFSRNDAFLWEVRTWLESGDYTAAGGLLSTLRRDPVFPQRLQNKLDEMEAYWHYKQQRWDSAAVHLMKALPGAEGRAERSRWQYLIAQLLERSGNRQQAAEWYAKAIATTADPLLEVYGRLNLVRTGSAGDNAAIDKSVAELVKMARRDKYEDYRDIIYYMAAQIELDRGNTAAAQALLLKGARYNNGNNASRNKAFLQIADAAYDQKNYPEAAAFYDSVQVDELEPAAMQRVNGRRYGLKLVMDNKAIVSRQDSLQRIAALPADQREAYVKKLVKSLRKQQGLKEEAAPSAGGFAGSAAPPAELFNSSKGEWYFYNANSRTEGAAAFKQLWGNRPNVDNWRRFAAVNQQVLRDRLNNQNVSNNTGNDAAQPEALELTVEGLTARLPLTEAGLATSNDSIKTSLMDLATAYQNELEDYPSAIATWEELRRRFPAAARMDEVLFNLLHAHQKTGNAAAAATVKKLLLDNHPASRYATIVATGKDPQSNKDEKDAATKAYEGVYDLFIEGRFAEAEAARRQADSTYKTTYWHPQLLYIESVYYIKQRDDSVAKARLQSIINQNDQPGMTDKAKNLLSVLNRRQQIEDELSRYQIQKQAEDTAVAVVAPPQVEEIDTVTVKRPTITAQATDKKAPVNVKLSGPKNVKDTGLLKLPPPKKAVDTLVKIPVAKPVDTLAKKPTPRRDTVARRPVPKPTDTMAKKPVLPKSNSIYTYAPDVPHMALVVLEKVDPVFVNEARTAFYRYNRERYYGQPLDAVSVSLTGDVKLVAITGFPSAQAATDWVQRAKSIAGTEIVPWLRNSRYSFSIISTANLELLKGEKDLPAYQRFLELYLPGKF